MRLKENKLNVTLGDIDDLSENKNPIDDTMLMGENYIRKKNNADLRKLDCKCGKNFVMTEFD